MEHAVLTGGMDTSLGTSANRPEVSTATDRGAAPESSFWPSIFPGMNLCYVTPMACQTNCW